MAAILAAGVIAAGAGMLASPSPANAHGATLFPGSRQYLCWVDGLTDTGQIAPTNPACQSWLDQSGTTPFYNWFADLDSNGQGRTEGYIPDGQICSGGQSPPFDFSPLDQARTDWPVTHLTAGASYEFRHNNWADHPGRFDIYLTRPGYNPTEPLSWSDLELIDSAQDPPASGGPGSLNYYFWDTTFPSDRSGLHLLFIHWVRSDSPENFYSCSDVMFDGGNGEVTCIGGDVEPPPPPEGCPDDPPTTPGPAIVSNITSTTAEASWGAADGCVTSYELVNVAGGAEDVLATVSGNPAPTATSLTGLTPDTSYAVSVRAVNDNTGAVSELSDDAPFTTPETDPEPEPGECTVAYDVIGDWGNGFQADVTVTNDGSSTINGWDLTWSFSGSEQIDQLWSARYQQSGANVTVSNESWNLNISGGGGSVNFGFLGSPGGGGEPTSFLLNGQSCTVA